MHVRTAILVSPLFLNCDEAVADVHRSGVNVIVYYSNFVLKLATGETELSKNEILLFSMGFGIINFVCALPAFYTIDTFGRRSLLLITFPFLALSQLLTAIGLALPGEGRSKGMVAIAGMYLFGFFYSFGEGPVPFVYAAESMPLYIRDVGMGCVTGVNWLFNWLIAFTAPALFQKSKTYGAFVFYAIWCVLLWILVFL
jgi:MFS family permease